jgi:hypothetical protein
LRIGAASRLLPERLAAAGEVGLLPRLRAPALRTVAVRQASEALDDLAVLLGVEDEAAQRLAPLPRRALRERAVARDGVALRGGILGVLERQ